MPRAAHLTPPASRALASGATVHRASRRGVSSTGVERVLVPDGGGDDGVAMSTPPSWPHSAPRSLPRAERARVAATLAATHDGVLHRALLREVGITKDDVRTEIRAGRWKPLGRHTVLIGNGEPSPTAARWMAVWESGAGAALDGVSALLAAGLTGFTCDGVDVSLPHRNRDHDVPGVRRHRRRARYLPLTVGIPRLPVDVAAVHAALWARSDRQAALILCLVVQQRLESAAHLYGRAVELGRGPRGRFIRAVARDLAHGAHSLGELDFAGMCRRVGLPEPMRQAVRRGPGGRVYLDAAWKGSRLVVEIDGAHHGLGLNPVDDALRQNAVTLGREHVLRIPVLGLRVTPEAFMAQVVQGYAQWAIDEAA